MENVSRIAFQNGAASLVAYCVGRSSLDCGSMPIIAPTLFHAIAFGFGSSAVEGASKRVKDRMKESLTSKNFVVDKGLDIFQFTSTVALRYVVARLFMRCLGVEIRREFVHVYTAASIACATSTDWGQSLVAKGALFAAAYKVISSMQQKKEIFYAVALKIIPPDYKWPLSCSQALSAGFFWYWIKGGANSICSTSRAQWKKISKARDPRILFISQVARFTIASGVTYCIMGSFFRKLFTPSFIDLFLRILYASCAAHASEDILEMNWEEVVGKATMIRDSAIESRLGAVAEMRDRAPKNGAIGSVPIQGASLAQVTQALCLNVRLSLLFHILGTYPSWAKDWLRGKELEQIFGVSLLTSSLFDESLKSCSKELLRDTQKGAEHIRNHILDKANFCALQAFRDLAQQDNARMFVAVKVVADYIVGNQQHRKKIPSFFLEETGEKIVSLRKKLRSDAAIKERYKKIIDKLCAAAAGKTEGADFFAFQEGLAAEEQAALCQLQTIAAPEVENLLGQECYQSALNDLDALHSLEQFKKYKCVGITALALSTATYIVGEKQGEEIPPFFCSYTRERIEELRNELCLSNEKKHVYNKAFENLRNNFCLEGENVEAAQTRLSLLGASESRTRYGKLTQARFT